MTCTRGRSPAACPCSRRVVVSEQVLSDGHGGIVLDRLGNCLSRHFDVEHSTFQLEAAQHRAHEGITHD